MIVAGLMIEAVSSSVETSPECSEKVSAQSLSPIAHLLVHLRIAGICDRAGFLHALANPPQ